MSLEHAPERQDGKRPASFRQHDPVFTILEVCADLGISRWTFNRNVRPHVEMVQVSVGRRGIRQSTLESYKAARTIPPARREEGPRK